MYKQHHLRSSVHFCFHKIKPSTLTAGTVESNFKGIIESFVERESSFSFMTSVKETPTYWKQFLRNLLAMVKNLWIITYFLTFPSAELNGKNFHILLTF